jgi:hypothetical protein
MNVENSKEIKLWLIYGGIMAFFIAAISIYAIYFGG